jgi:hypothetical protein
MFMTVFAAVPVMAQTGVTTYNYEGYKVEYNVQNEWIGFQTIDVKVTNTGTEPIINWAFKYDAGGEILGVHNGEIFDNNGTAYIIKNAVHNYEIAPNSSVNFGYTLKSDNHVAPEKFENLAKRVVADGGYNVEFEISSLFDTSFNGVIKITNTSGSALEAWELSFDSNFTVSNLWNGKIVGNEGNSYTVASQMSSNPIQPGAFVEIGISGDFGIGVVPAIENASLSVIKIIESDDEPVIGDALMEIINAYDGLKITYAP